MRTAPLLRNASACRKTREAVIEASIELDRALPACIQTGHAMFDHLLAQWAFHAGCTLQVRAQSLDAIVHHVVEDTAIAIGDALNEALGGRSAIARYGDALLPMDDALVRAAVDLAARSFARVELPLRAERVEGLETALIPHFFRTLSSRARFTLHIDLLAGEDPHHCAEAAFKAAGRAMRAAWAPRFDGDANSTKGQLT